jgi:hypothetical protein
LHTRVTMSYRKDRNICLIELKRDTRQHLKEVAKKSQTYDDLINELLALKEQKFQDD